MEKYSASLSTNANSFIFRVTELFGRVFILIKNLRERVRVERQISNLKYSLSVDALQLSDEYQNRIEVLKKLGYVDRTGMVTFKGRVACEIHHQELLITELILSKKLHERSPAEVAAMLSATTCQYKGGDGPKFEKDSVFEKLKEDVQSTNGMIENVASSFRVRIGDVGDELRYDLMQVVYHWAGGMKKISEICFDSRMFVSPYVASWKWKSAPESSLVQRSARMDNQ
ncbi:DSHCT domain protein [Necator americanus]|uniref:DSHCT domain protein n=1 Tax=Necator americanus TaxID=51031 RepID=W2SJX9_NECAM|nr:DSHCT domain protein [Necator americanus]ETN69910.1 DSHCT domain protein [Necator americanus]